MPIVTSIADRTRIFDGSIWPTRICCFPYIYHLFQKQETFGRRGFYCETLLQTAVRCGKQDNATYVANYRSLMT